MQVERYTRPETCHHVRATLSFGLALANAITCICPSDMMYYWMRKSPM